MDELTDILQSFPPISLEEMQAVKLMNRIDTKYLVSRSRLPEILSHLTHHFYVQELSGRRIAHYNTLYYDTSDVQMYHVHHAGKLNRQKLRARIYCETQTAFCEIKTKNNKKRTKKKRIEISLDDFSNMLVKPEVNDFVSKKLRYNILDLFPQVENEFDRITLVNMGKSERLTIDTNICFRNRYTHNTAEIPHLVIIELKQDGNIPSFFKSVLLEMRIHPYRISKYCLGTMLTNPGVKMNRFKKKLRYIDKLKTNF